MNLRLNTGLNIELGRVIASGGEGIVYELRSAPDLVAKIYATTPDALRIAKLEAMVSLPSEGRPQATAWPSNLIMRGDKVVGFTMTRLRDRREIHDLFVGAARRRHFPKSDYRMLVAAAANVARAVATVHAAGHVIGDLNERCALLDGRATVMLIDCDSFQVEVGERLFTCDVGRPEYQPPELQSVQSFRGLRRTRNHDAFGLAVLIFQMLFLGRHPFAGRPSSGEPPEIPEAIRDLRFAWAGVETPAALLQPPNTIPLTGVGTKVGSYFKRAFGDAGAREGRPKAAAWAHALDMLKASLVKCSTNPTHWHMPGECVLCSVERVTGQFLFAPATPPGLEVEEAEVAGLWASIEAEPPPPARPNAPSPDDFRGKVSGKPYPSIPQRGFFDRMLQKVGLLAKDDQQEAEKRERKRAAEKAMTYYDGLYKYWKSYDKDAKFLACKGDLLATREKIFQAIRQCRDNIASSVRQQGMQRYLAGFDLQDAKLEGIGPRRKATLESFGIETAADVTIAALSAVPGFGAKRRGILIAWRNRVEAGYKPTPGVIPDPIVAARLIIQCRRDIQAPLGKLRAGAMELRKIHSVEKLRTESEIQKLSEAAKAAAQANADLNGETA